MNILPAESAPQLQILFIYFYHSKRQAEEIPVYDFNVVELPPVWDLWVTAEAVSVTSTGRADQALGSMQLRGSTHLAQAGPLVPNSCLSCK